MMKDKSVAIILVNWNGFEHTIKCINSLRDLTYRNYEVIVVDNGSDPKELIELKKITNIKLIENGSNLGFTGGNNVGMSYAYSSGFDCIMLLNNDTTVEPGFLEPLLQVLIDDNVGAVQPKIYSMHESNVLWSAGGTFNKLTGKPKTRGAGEYDEGHYDCDRDLDWITGCCLTFRKEMIDKVGYLNDLYFIMCEDVDWSLRAKNLGLSLQYVPESRILHFESASAKSSIKSSEGTRSPLRQYQNVRNHLFIIRKYVPPMYWIFAFFDQSIKILTHLCYYALKGRKEKFRLTVKGLVDGLRRFE